MTTVFDSTLILVVGIRGTSINVSKTNKNTNIKLNCLYVYPFSEGNKKKIMLLKEVPHVYKYIYASISFQKNRSFLTYLCADIG